MPTPSPDQPPKQDSLWWLASWAAIPLGLLIGLMASGLVSSSEWGWNKIGVAGCGLLGGGILCVVLCVVSLARRERFGGLSLIPAFPCALLFLWGIGYLINDNLERRQHRAEEALFENLTQASTKDPSIILKERWDLKPGYTHRRAVEAALDNPETPLSGDLARTMYQSMPSLRNPLLRHSSFDSAFLEEKLPEAEGKAEAPHPNNDPEMLMNIIKNPNCPLSVVEQVAHIRDKQDAYERCTYAFNILSREAERILRKRARPPESQPQKSN